MYLPNWCCNIFNTALKHVRLLLANPYLLGQPEPTGLSSPVDSTEGKHKVRKVWDGFCVAENGVTSRTFIRILPDH